MEQLNIKDYLELNQKKKEIQKKKTEYSFSLVFDNGSDFVIERNNSRHIKRQLCFIASEDLLFIRDPKNKVDNPVDGEAQIKNFFDIDSNINGLEFKNAYFKTDSVSSFAYKCVSLHKKKDSTRRNFIKYGYNPDDFLWKTQWGGDAYIEAIGRFPFNQVLNIIKLLEEYKEGLKKKNGDYKPQVCAEFTLFLLRLQDIYSIDYVKIFLEEFCKYDSKMDISLNNYFGGQTTSEYRFVNFEKPIKEFNLDFRRYCTYLFRDLYAQGISDINSDILSIYYDTLSLQKQMYDKVKEKYPDHLKETHDKTVLIFNLNAAYFKEKKIEALNIHNKELEMKDKEYSIIVAKTSQDLITEGINLHHCVGSYVDRVKNGDCSIFFLRKTNEIDNSLITIEVRDDRVVQVRGLCERRMNNEERQFLKKWIANKRLTFVGE